MSVNDQASREIDVRIVQTVRALKDHIPKDQKQDDSDNSDKTSGDSSQRNEDKKSKITDHLSHTNLKHINLNQSIDKRNSFIEIPEKVIINQKGNCIKPPINPIANKKIAIESRYKNQSSSSESTHKSRSNFLKNLMNDTSMKKYKATCLSLLKDDKEIKELCEVCGVAYTNYSFDNFLEKTFFTNQLFLYKLEMLLASDQVLNKNYKDKFFKKEIQTVLHMKSLEIKSKIQRESLSERFVTCYGLIEKIDFSKD